MKKDDNIETRLKTYRDFPQNIDYHKNPENNENSAYDPVRHLDFMCKNGLHDIS